MRMLRIPLIVSCIAILFLTLLSIYLRNQEDAGLLRVTFLDVGQGDATLIESPTGTQVLIDGGKGRSVLRVLSRELGFFDRSIDVVIATHPDQDHIGGLVDVLKRYRVSTIIMTENKSNTPVYEMFARMIEAEGAEVLRARAGQLYDIGIGDAGSTTLTILFPDLDPSALESNTSSIVSRLTYGDVSYLFTGDAPQAIEEYLVSRLGTHIDSDVLKVGHHGSRTSSAEVFVSTVLPSYAIISAGKDNAYGHPHREVTDLLNEYGIVQKNTTDLGSIRSYSDGKRLWFEES